MSTSASTDMDPDLVTGSQTRRSSKKNEIEADRAAPAARKKVAENENRTKSRDRQSKQTDQGQRKDIQLNEDICGRCNKRCEENEKSLQCELCDMWFHAECEQIDEVTYSVLKKDGEKQHPLIHFYCSNTCNRAASKFLGNFVKMENEVCILKERVNKVDSHVKSIQEGDFTEAMKKSVLDIVRDEKESTKSTACDANEIEERLRRNKNLIFFNLEESVKSETAERIEEDSKKLITVLNQIDIKDCSTSTFEQTTRLGKKGDSPRPLKVRFRTTDECTRVLKSARKLKGSNIYISRDMTPLERKEWKELLEERNKKRLEAMENGTEAKWVIRRGKVVNISREERHPRTGKADNQ